MQCLQVYNDLSSADYVPSKEGSEELERPVLGGSKPYKYPRRLYTGRPLIEGGILVRM